jgi:hypothetical protein
MKVQRHRPFDMVPVEDLPEYPADLMDAPPAADFFIKFFHIRWLNSRLHLTASQQVQGMALNLFMISRSQNPMGSLPNDEAVIARLLRVSQEEWRAAVSQPIGPLHGWRQYLASDQIVLGHAVVIEGCQDAISRREARDANNEEKRVAQRLKRLAETMQAIGCRKDMCADVVLVQRIDEWLLANHNGQRRRPQFDALIRRALDHAARMGWISSAVRPL